MVGKETVAAGNGETFRPCGRAFFVYYVAMAICFFGPSINPAVGMPVWLGLFLGLVLVVVVAYFRWGQDYRVTSQGVMKVWRWPDRRQEITWAELGEVQVRRGLTQTLLKVGNLAFLDASGHTMMFWFGLSDPRAVKAVIEGRRS